MRKSPYYLTKSRFKLALECPTKLFYADKDEYANNKNDDEFLESLAEGGFQVGELAKYYYDNGMGHDVKSLDYEKSISETKYLLNNKNVIIYEPAIQYANFFIRVDVLVKNGNKVDLIEVKAKSYKSIENFYDSQGFISQNWRPYLFDIAFQNWVAQQAYPEWEISPYLMLVDKNKKTSVDNLNQNFKVIKNASGRKEVKIVNKISSDTLGEEILSKIDVSKMVNQIWNGKDIAPSKKKKEDMMDFSERAKIYSTIYRNDERYPIELGLKCKHCEFKTNGENSDKNLKSGFDECWRSIYPDFSNEEPHIFDIWNFRGSEDLIKKGVIYQKDIYESKLVNLLNSRQLLQVEKTVKQSQTEQINPELFSKMNDWNFPLHFIDFETSMVAVPFNKNRHPYEQIAFQFSCHTLHKDNTIEHDEWISTEQGEFPNYNFIKALKRVLDKDKGDIFCYAPHENTVLRKIHDQMVEENEEQYSEWIEWIDTITHWKDKHTKIDFVGERNMIDILVLIKKYYYHPKMKGSNSIKAVLPAIFHSSKYIKKKYSSKVGIGQNLSPLVLYKVDSNGDPLDPYKILPNKYTELGLELDGLSFERGDIQEGGSAMTAYAKMQFSDMDFRERKALKSALLQYCEMDTLAMLMIYEHWNSLK